MRDEINVITCSGNSDTVWTALECLAGCTPATSQFRVTHGRHDATCETILREFSASAKINSHNHARNVTVQFLRTYGLDYARPMINAPAMGTAIATPIAENAFPSMAIAKILDHRNRLYRESLILTNLAERGTIHSIYSAGVLQRDIGILRLC